MGSLDRKGLPEHLRHESDRVFGCRYYLSTQRNRNFAVAELVRSKNEVDNVHLFGGNAVAVVTKSCEIEVCWINTSTNTKQKSMPTQSSFMPPSCDILLGSAFHNDSNVLALLSTVPKGSRYLLSLLRLPMHRGDGPDLISQCKLPPFSLFSSSSAKPILNFNADGSRILLGTTERCFVTHTTIETSVMWSPKQRQFASLMLHDKYLFGVRGKTISIYDTTRDDVPIVSGQISSDHDKPDSIFLFGGRLWMLCATQLLCTPRLVQNLNKLSPTGGACNFKVDISHTFGLDSLSSRFICKRGNFLYVSSGQMVRLFDRKDVSSPLVFTADAEITSMFADDTKVVCSTKHPNGRSGRIELFPIDAATRTAFRSVFVKRTFLSSHTMDNVRICGRLLSVSYSYDGEASSKSEVQVFDLLQDLDGR